MDNTKNLLYLIGLFLCLTACHKDKPQPPPPAHINTLSAEDNGSLFYPATIDVFKQPYASSDFCYLFISAETASHHALSLLIYFADNLISTGQFTIGDKANALYSSQCGGICMLTAVTGKVSITGVDTTTYSNGVVATGSFDFITEDDVISKGAFSVFIPN